MRRTKSTLLRSIACLTAICLVACNLAGCLLIPEAAPLLGHEWKKRIMFDVIRGVQCEIRWSVMEQLKRDRSGDYGARKLVWFEKWNALIDLNLQIEDALAFNPGVSLKTPNWVDASVGLGDYSQPRAVAQSYNLGLGGGVSYTTSREDKVQFAYPFGIFVDDGQPHLDSPARCYNIGGVAISANLKINDWLDDVLEPIRKCAFLGLPAREDDPITPIVGGSEVILTDTCRRMDFSKSIGGDPITSISHKITFRLTFNANVTPSWDLVRVATTASPLFDASRKDTSELLMTFGPPAPGARITSLKVALARGAPKQSPRADSLALGSRISTEMLLTHNALQIGSAVRDALQ